MNGTADATSGGLRKRDLKRVTTGKGVSKRTRIVPVTKSADAKRRMPPQLKMWRAALKEYGLLRKGEFVAIRKGTADYREVKKLYNEKLRRAGY